jgi:hypothetical protein
MVLTELAERFGVPDSRGTLLMPELAQEELAEIIGSSRPMVSKLLTEMTERGILIREGRRHILLTTVKPGNPTAPSQREASLHPAFEPNGRNGRVRAERRTTRGNPAPAANI